MIRGTNEQHIHIGNGHEYVSKTWDLHYEYL